MARVSFCSSAFFILLTSALAAQDLSRTDAVQHALESNPQLRAAAVEIERARATLRYAGRLSNPELEFGGRSDFAGNNEKEGSIELGITQELPITGRLSRAKVLRKEQVRLAEAEFLARQHELAYETDQAWIQLAVARQAARIPEDLRDLNRELVAFMEDRVALGEISRLDLAQARLAGREIEQQLGESRAQVESAEGAMKSRLGLAPETELPPLAEVDLPETAPPADLDAQKIDPQRPELVILAMRGQTTAAELALALDERWADVALSLFAEREWEEGQPNTLVGVSVSIPLPVWDRNEAAIADARLQKEQVKRELAALRFQIRSELTGALDRRHREYQLARDAAGEILQLARENFRDFETAYQQGQADLLQVQQARERFLNLRTTALDRQRDYLLADARVKFLSGNYALLPGSQDFQPAKNP